MQEVLPVERLVRDAKRSETIVRRNQLAHSRRVAARTGCSGTRGFLRVPCSSKVMRRVTRAESDGRLVLFRCKTADGIPGIVNSDPVGFVYSCDHGMPSGELLNENVIDALSVLHVGAKPSFT